VFTHHLFDRRYTALIEVINFHGRRISGSDSIRNRSFSRTGSASQNHNWHSCRIRQPRSPRDLGRFKAILTRRIFLPTRLRKTGDFHVQDNPGAEHTLVLEAFDTLFNKSDYPAAQRYWSDRYIQHSAHIAPGRNGLFNLIRTLKYENQLIVAEGDYVIAHDRFSGNGRPRSWIAADILRIEDDKLAEHWDVLRDEVTEAHSVSGLPEFFNVITFHNRNCVSRWIDRPLAPKGGTSAPTVHLPVISDDVLNEVEARGTPAALRP
jgi:predicted SnoaL-like aldol condensation-catalyzing enzyme